ncbi:MAG: hypothetical protein Q8S33_31465 [Myxococcales bacterium]|nr:hypothetical protein [Myxococcales bacterium]
MDFSQAQFEGVAPGTTQCAVCQQPLTAQYWSANSAMVCGACAAQVQAGPPAEGGVLRILKALLFGGGAGLVGAIGYGLIIHYARMELALITILIGWLVGKAVRLGSEDRGGRVYQVMGAVLTYVFCMMAYVPEVVTGATSQADSIPFIVAVIISPFIALIIPFTGDMSFLSILILGFGVWRGWREPAKLEIAVTGPFELSDAPAEAEPAATAAAP